MQKTSPAMRGYVCLDRDTRIYFEPELMCLSHVGSEGTVKCLFLGAMWYATTSWTNI